MPLQLLGPFLGQWAMPGGISALLLGRGKWNRHKSIGGEFEYLSEIGTQTK